MRLATFFAALVLGLTLVGPASAQGFGANGNGRNNGKIGLWGTSSYLSSPFRLTSLFGSFRGALLPGGTRTNAGTPNPNDPNYLKAFGYRKLF